MKNEMFALKEKFANDVTKYAKLVYDKTGSEELFYIVPEGDHMRVARKGDNLVYELHANSVPVLVDKIKAFTIAKKFMLVAEGNHELISERAWNFRYLRAAENVLFAMVEAEQNNAA